MNQEAVLSVVRDDRLVAIIRHDPVSRHQVFYKVEEMGSDDIKDLYEEIEPQTTAA